MRQETIVIFPGVPDRIVAYYTGQPSLEVTPLPSGGPSRIADDGIVYSAEMEKNVIVVREEGLAGIGWVLDKQTRQTLIDKTVQERKSNHATGAPGSYKIAHRLVNETFSNLGTEKREEISRDVQKAADRVLKSYYNRTRR